MALFFTISIRFLDPRFHGRADADTPEWPPSPARVFQAMVAAAALLDRGRPIPTEAKSALEWLEHVSLATPPRIFAPPVHEDGPGYRLSVPNNALDIVGKAWSRGNDSMTGDANPATHRAMKSVRPTRFREGDTVCFAWPLRDPVDPAESGHVEVLSKVARHVVALGWGVDLVVGSAGVLDSVTVDAIAGERWVPGVNAARRLRVPIPGTLDALIDRHGRFLQRIQGNAFIVPPPMKRFALIGYRRPHDLEQRAGVVFALRHPVEPTRFRAFDATRETMLVAAHMRHAAHETAKRSKADAWSLAAIASFILGHAEPHGAPHRPAGPRRFAYLPLPSIQVLEPPAERVGAFRRVLVTTFVDDCEGEVAWAERALAGQELTDEETGESVALLEPISGSDSVVRRYLPARGASSWATVTPVVLPGHDDPKHIRRRIANGVTAAEQHRLLEQLEKRTDALLRKAILQAGFPQSLARDAFLSWRRVGFWPGTETAGRYRVPAHLERFPRLHVRIDWRDPDHRPIDVAGPICIGGGRYCGLGLFAAMASD